MKRTISITLNKVIFQVEEDGFLRLKSYLDSINEFYGPENGREILADIESSMAEKFESKINGKKYITLEDVEEAIKILGTVEQFSREAETEPGAGKKNTEPQAPRRLYRNPDDKIVGGVCSGLAAYFGVDPVFVRLIFVVVTLFYGTGIIAYLILWIVLPEAKSGAQKLEMQGRPVNLEEIREAVISKSQMIKEESVAAFNNLKNRGWFYRVINFPIRVIERIFYAIKKILKFFWPIVCGFFGLIFLVGGLAAILGLSIAAGTLAFNASSPYIVSDIPIADLVASPYFYLGLGAIYFTALVPLIFIFIAGLSIFKRKLAVSGIAAGMLIALWMMAIVGTVAISTRYAPEVRARIIEYKSQSQAAKSFDYKDFEKIYIGAGVNAKIIRGDEFKINAIGAQRDLDLLKFNIEEGQLQVEKADREEKGLCVFCFDDSVDLEITMPKLASLVVISHGQAEVAGFKEDLYISLGEAGKAEVKLEGQNVQAQLSGVASALTLTGRAGFLEAQMDGGARLKTNNFEADRIKIGQSVFSRSTLAGKVKDLEVGVFGNAQMRAFDLEAQNAKVSAGDYAFVQVNAVKKLDINARDKSSVKYKGNPEDLVVNTVDYAEAEQEEAREFDDFEIERE